MLVFHDDHQGALQPIPTLATGCLGEQILELRETNSNSGFTDQMQDLNKTLHLSAQWRQ